MVGNGDAVSVAAEILQNMLGSSKGRFAVNHPVVTEEWPQEGGEGLRVGQELQLATARDIHRRLGAKGTLAPWFRKARAFVHSNWRAIEMVARDLIETKTLDGTEVETIVSIADGEPDAKEGLTRYRLLRGSKGTLQFPFKGRTTGPHRRRS